MATTPILGITELADGQIDQFITANEAFEALEAASNDFLAVDLTSGDVVLTGAQFTDYFFFRCSGHSVVRALTVPQSKRFFAVQNLGTEAVNVTRGTSTATVAVGQAGIFYTDGTANGLVAIASGGGGGNVVEQATIDASPYVVDLTDDTVNIWVIDIEDHVDDVELPLPPTNGALSLVLIIRMGGSGNYTINWPGVITWKNGTEPVLDPDPGAVTTVALLGLDLDNIWLGSS